MEKMSGAGLDSRFLGQSGCGIWSPVNFNYLNHTNDVMRGIIFNIPC